MKLIIGILIFTFLVLLGYGSDKHEKTNKEGKTTETEQEQEPETEEDE